MTRLTLETIGQLAGVSRATVSRVINNHPNISDEVRERVQRVIAETGYQPNAAARSLASSESRIIGLVIPNVISAVFTDPYYPRLTQGISAACNRLGYILALFLFHTLEEERTAVQRLSSNALLDGLILTADTIENPLMPQLIARQMPFVYVGRPTNEDPQDVTYVDVDQMAGAMQAVAHLSALGYQRIGEIATAHNAAGLDRHRGYQQALQRHGLAYDEALVAYGDFTEGSGYTAMQQLLPQGPDAVFVQSDGMGLGAWRAIRDAGLRVPDDVALVSFDDLPPALLAEPPLTTVRQPIHRTGEIAVELLVERLQQPDKMPEHVILPTELVIRASCGAQSESVAG